MRMDASCLKLGISVVQPDLLAAGLPEDKESGRFAFDTQSFKPYSMLGDSIARCREVPWLNRGLACRLDGCHPVVCRKGCRQQA